MLGSGVESSCVSTYVEDLMDCLEWLPDRIQPHVSTIRRLDWEYTSILAELARLHAQLKWMDCLEWLPDRIQPHVSTICRLDWEYTSILAELARLHAQLKVRCPSIGMLGSGVESSCVSTYVEDLMDCLEWLPDRIQPHVSTIRRLDWEYTSILAELARLHAQLKVRCPSIGMLGSGVESSCVSTYVEDLMDCLEWLPDRIQPHVSTIRRLDWEYTSILAELARLHAQLKVRCPSIGMLGSGVESSCVSTYVEDLMDCLEWLPDRIQPHVSTIRRLDWEYTSILAELARLHAQLKAEVGAGEVAGSAERRGALVGRMKALLYAGQTNGEAKLAEVASISEAADAKLSQLDNDSRNFEPQAKRDGGSGKMSIIGSRAGAVTRNGKSSANHNDEERWKEERCSSVRSTDGETSQCSKSGGVKRPRRQKQFPDFIRDPDLVKKEREAEREADSPVSPPPPPPPPAKKAKKSWQATAARKRSATKPPPKTLGQPVDPDEKTYCLCNQVSWGEMIGCDYDGCELEWFHFTCVQLSSKPKGRWYCPSCRGDKPNSLHPSLSK